mgnify:CR=1 FL=1
MNSADDFRPPSICRKSFTKPVSLINRWGTRRTRSSRRAFRGTDHASSQIPERGAGGLSGSRGRGALHCNRATADELETAAEAIRADPRNWVAQPIIDLSTAPTLVEEGIEPRHLDLRPFILTGEHSYVTAGGLTRVALTKGSLVVNSSQGGGSKDTWIVEGSR